jgi:hypothetical protein
MNVQLLLRSGTPLSSVWATATRIKTLEFCLLAKSPFRTATTSPFVKKTGAPLSPSFAAILAVCQRS